MDKENDIRQKLESRFAFLAGKVTVQRARRIFADVPADKFAGVFDCAVREMGFVILCTITGLDLGADLGFIYHLSREDGITLNLSISVPKTSPVIQSVTPYFSAADAYEREVVDLLGAQVQGLPPGSRYPLPDDWPKGQYPLRKDWKVDMLTQPDMLPKKEADHA